MQKDLQRDTVFQHFLLQQVHFASIQQVKPLPRGFSFTCTFQGKQVHGVVLVQSSDYWQYRLHLARTPIGLVVCHRHDSLLPVNVLSLEDGREYAPEDLPKKYETLDAVKTEHSRHAAKVLIGALLCGVAAAHDMLLAMPESTRRKYEAKMHRYQRRMRGRPVAV